MASATTRLISLVGASIFRTTHTNPKTLSPIRFPKLLLPHTSLKLRHHYCAASSSSAAAVLDTDPAAVAETTVTAAAQSHHPWPEWVNFVDRLKSKGYFLESKKEDWDGSDGVVYKDKAILKDVCLSFARDRFDIFKSLSMEDMKTLVEKGCPNIARKTVNSGKRLRAYVQLDEGDVCSGCNLRGSCDRAYVILTDNEATARTVDIVRILLNFALDPLVVTGETPAGRELVELSARKLLSELTELSETTPDPPLPPPTTKVTSRKEQSPSFTDDEPTQNVEMQRGDWMCSKCNFLNFARNKRCLKCREDGPLRVDGNDVEMKEGDWVCSQCNFMNFARNTQCLKCKAKAGQRVEGLEAGNVELKKGDWNCPQCSFMNFARNFQCLKCKGEKPKSLDVRNVEMKRGDWICSECQFMNFASNTTCKRCKGPPTKEMNPTKKELNPGEWECPSCDFLNFKRNNACLKCDCKRPKKVESNYEEQMWKKPF